jgi:hypothetical protein
VTILTVGDLLRKKSLAARRTQTRSALGRPQVKSVKMISKKYGINEQPFWGLGNVSGKKGNH